MHALALPGANSAIFLQFRQSDLQLDACLHQTLSRNHNNGNNWPYLYPTRDTLDSQESTQFLRLPRVQHLLADIPTIFSGSSFKKFFILLLRWAKRAQLGYVLRVPSCRVSLGNKAYANCICGDLCSLLQLCVSQGSKVWKKYGPTVVEL